MIKQIQERNESVQPNDRILATLHRDFPQCFTSEGKFDLEKFISLVQGRVDIAREGYELNFLGKSYANLIANTETETVIVPDTEHNSKPENQESRNIYISGDNIDALKHLLKSYTGSIKCIYIDPPYNTGSDGFVYNDRFDFTAEQLQIKLGVDEEKAKHILDLTKRGSASHSAWLMFMAPRLTLARDLLSDNGVIFISIDDNEQSNLKLLCDEIFGEENFQACIAWRRRTNQPNDKTKMIAKVSETILCFSKNNNSLSEHKSFRGVPLSEKRRSEYSNPDNDINGAWSTNPWKAAVGRGGTTYSITTPTGVIFTETWYGTKETFEQYKLENRVYWTDNGNGLPRIKIYLKDAEKDGQSAINWFPHEIFGSNQEGSAEVDLLFSKKGIFDNPKPTKLIHSLLHIASDNDSTIIDFFSGSSTTADAIMQLNSEDDNGNRRFIMVQIPEPTPAGSEARKAGYETIDQIGQERIRRAAQKIREAHPDRAETMDLGFKHYTLREVQQNTLDKLQNFDTTLELVDESVLDIFGKETVLATWLVQDGYGFGAKAEELPLAGYIAYVCASHLYFITHKNFDENAMIALIDKYNREPDFNPQNIVVFGYSFTFTQLEMLRKNMHTLMDGAKNLKINLDIRY